MILKARIPENEVVRLPFIQIKHYVYQLIKNSYKVEQYFLIKMYCKTFYYPKFYEYKPNVLITKTTFENKNKEGA